MSVDRESLFYDTESILLGHIKNGYLSFEAAVKKYHELLIENSTSSSATFSIPDSLLVYCSLACRQAISAGLSPSSAFAICKRFVSDIGPSLSEADSLQLITDITSSYIRCVHSRRGLAGLSDSTQKSLEYIDNNLNKKILAADLAAITGEREYSLTRRFMLEVGVTVNDYIKNAKVERAKIYLSSSDLRIQDISASLGFTTTSYFSTCFKEVTGVSPDFYRSKNRRKL